MSFNPYPTPVPLSPIRFRSSIKVGIQSRLCSQHFKKSSEYVGFIFSQVKESALQGFNFAI